MKDLYHVHTAEGFERKKELILDFENTLRVPSFPKENEREPLKNILERVCNPNSRPRSGFLISVDKEDGTICGGAIYDYYPEADAIEIIYLVLDEKKRKRGIATSLINQCTSLYPDIKDVYVEVDNPSLVEDNMSVINPKTRIAIYEKLGFRAVPISYVQWPLDEGFDYERGLILMRRSADGKALSKQRLIRFLSDFYAFAGFKDDPELLTMINEINSIEHYEAIP